MPITRFGKGGQKSQPMFLKTAISYREKDVMNFHPNPQHNIGMNDRITAVVKSS